MTGSIRIARNTSRFPKTVVKQTRNMRDPRKTSRANAKEDKYMDST